MPNTRCSHPGERRHLYLYAGPLTVANFSIDHHNPISGGGDFSIGNIFVCDMRRNKIKANLNHREFLRLTAFIAQLPQEVGKPRNPCG